MEVHFPQKDDERKPRNHHFSRSLSLLALIKESDHLLRRKHHPIRSVVPRGFREIHQRLERMRFVSLPTKHRPEILPAATLDSTQFSLYVNNEELATASAPRCASVLRTHRGVYEPVSLLVPLGLVKDPLWEQRSASIRASAPPGAVRSYPCFPIPRKLILLRIRGRK
jgi:hypothetical protein